MKPWSVGVLVFLFTWSLTTHGKYSVSGDEPHYLMVAQSLAADHDLDLRNNYAQDDGRLFGHEGLPMEAHARVARDGRTQTTHDIGLPILLLPVYSAARQLAAVPSDDTVRRFRMTRGLLVYSIVSTSLIALTAAAAALLFSALTRIAAPSNAALATLAAALSPPVVSHAFLIFPEVPAFAVTCAVVWYCTRPASASDRWLVPAFAAALGLMPWTHRKYSFYVLGLAALIVWMRRSTVMVRPRAQLAAAAALFAVLQLAFHAWTVATWGTIGGPQMLSGLPFTTTGVARGAIGLFADRASGLLAYAPMYWILPACIVLTWRRTWPFLAVAALMIVPMASFVVWWAGFAPAARYLVPTIPLLVVPIALALRRRWIKVAFCVLLAAQAAIDAYVWQYPRTLWPSDPILNPALDRLGLAGRAYEQLLPALQQGPLDWRVAAVLTLAVAITAAALVSETASAPIRQRT